MLELGASRESLHRESRRARPRAGLDLLITVGGGPAARAGRARRSRAGMPDDASAHVATKREAADVALRQVRAGDLVLVKGSRGIGTDLVVDRLKEEFA